MWIFKEYIVFQVVQKEKVKAKGPQEEPPHSIIKNFPSPSTMISTNPSGWFIKKEKKKGGGRREIKSFVDTSENVFETLNVKYRSRFPSGISTFARGPHRVYSSPD